MIFGLINILVSFYNYGKKIILKNLDIFFGIYRNNILIYIVDSGLAYLDT